MWVWTDSRLNPPSRFWSPQPALPSQREKVSRITKGTEGSSLLKLFCFSATLSYNQAEACQIAVSTHMTTPQLKRTSEILFIIYTPCKGNSVLSLNHSSHTTYHLAWPTISKANSGCVLCFRWVKIACSVHSCTQFLLGTSGASFAHLHLTRLLKGWTRSSANFTVLILLYAGWRDL